MTDNILKRSDDLLGQAARLQSEIPSTIKELNANIDKTKKELAELINRKTELEDFYRLLSGVKAPASSIVEDKKIEPEDTVENVSNEKPHSNNADDSANTVQPVKKVKSKTSEKKKETPVHVESNDEDNQNIESDVYEDVMNGDKEPSELFALNTTPSNNDSSSTDKEEPGDDDEPVIIEDDDTAEQLFGSDNDDDIDFL